MEKFATLDCPRSWRIRQDILTNLFESLIQAEMTILIVKNKPGFMEKFSVKNGNLLDGRVIYSIAEEIKIQPWIKYLQRLKLWHKPIFHIVVGDNNLPVLLAEYCENENVSWDDAEKKLSQHIEGVIEPLDDNLGLYGGNTFKSVIESKFPESIE